MKRFYISGRKVVGDEWVIPLLLIPALRPLLPEQYRTREAGDDLELKISIRFMNSRMLYVETSQSVLVAATCCLVWLWLTLFDFVDERKSKKNRINNNDGILTLTRQDGKDRRSRNHVISPCAMIVRQRFTSRQDHHSSIIHPSYIIHHPSSTSTYYPYIVNVPSS